MFVCLLNWTVQANKHSLMSNKIPILGHCSEPIDYEGDVNDPYVAKSRKVVSSTVCSFRMKVTGSTLIRKNETFH